MKLALEDADTLVSMGSMFLAIGDIGCATHCLLEAVEIDSANADAYYYLGALSAIKGEFEDAAEFFTHTLDIRKEHIPSLRDSASVYLAMGKLTDAAKRIKKARGLESSDSQLKKLDRTVTLARIKRHIINSLCRFRPRFIFRNSLR